MKIIYEDWDLTIPKMKPRTLLYKPEPIGIGTPLTESLTSYVERLALIHCVSPMLLILTKIEPLLNRERVLQQDDKSLEKVYGGRTQALNGTGVLASKLVQALESLTLRQDLRFLTMLTWGEALSNLGLLRPHRSWCTTCYEEWRKEGKIVYQPLIWSFALIDICLQHHQPLLHRCPYCQQQLPTLAGGSRPGYCSKCDSWLGHSAPNVEPDSRIFSDEEIKWQTHVSDNIGELIATAPQLSFSPTREMINQAINNCINYFCGGDITKFLELTELSYANILVYKKINTITIKKLLFLANKLGISIVTFLIKNNYNGYKKPELQSKVCTELKTFKKLSKEDVTNIKNRLQTALVEDPPPSLKDVANLSNYSLDAIKYHYPDLCHALVTRGRNYRKLCIQAEIELALKEEPPPSLIDLTKRLGYKNNASLYNLFPSLCHQISERFKEYDQSTIIERKRQEIQEIREIAINLHSKGKKPTMGNVGKFMKSPGSLRQHPKRIALRQVRKELGYQD